MLVLQNGNNEVGELLLVQFFSEAVGNVLNPRKPLTLYFGGVLDMSIWRTSMKERCEVWKGRLFLAKSEAGNLIYADNLL